jgi:hypothetical protein
MSKRKKEKPAFFPKKEEPAQISNTIDRDVWDEGLRLLMEACNCLEARDFDIKEAKAATCFAKKGTNLLEHGYELMKNGITRVGRPIAKPGEPLFDGKGNPMPGAESEPEAPSEPTPMPFRPVPTLVHTEPKADPDADAIDVEAEPTNAESTESESETDTEVDGMAAIKDRNRKFRDYLNTLKKEGIKQGRSKERWKDFRKSWEAAYKANPKKTLDALMTAITNGKSGDIFWAAPIFEDEANGEAE